MSKDENKEYEIIINGRPKAVTEKKLNFIEIVMLAFGAISSGANTIYTMTFKKGSHHHKEGSLVDGDYIKIKTGMIFNVTATDKS